MHKVAARKSYIFGGEAVLGRLQRLVTVAAIALAAVALLEHHAGYISLIAIAYLLVVGLIDKFQPGQSLQTPSDRSFDGGAVKEMAHSHAQADDSFSLYDGGTGRRARC